MIERIRKFFDANLGTPKSGQAPSAEALQLAAVALMFEVGRSDFEVDAAELEHITEAVRGQFQISDEQTRVLLELAREHAEHATSLHGFTSLINDHWTLEQKLQLVEYMWRVAYADRHLNDHEVHLMRKIARLLYIPHRQFITAKLRARK
jgi:uncharacterized tellurite resistance protein B-like protein